MLNVVMLNVVMLNVVMLNDKCGYVDYRMLSFNIYHSCI
jgi:hypothetical protein